MKIIANNEEINNLDELFNNMNDGMVFNQDYRQGVLDTIDFLIYKESKLKRIMNLLKKELKKE